MYRSTRLVIVTILFVLCFGINAQIPEPPKSKAPETTINVIARSFGDSIVVRWAPTHLDNWVFGNQQGYEVFRYKVLENETEVIDVPIREKLSREPVKPLALKEIEHYYRTDPYAPIVAQAIYGESFNLNQRSDDYNFISMATQLSNRYSFALFSCDMSLNAARSHGLLYTDKNVEYGAKYVYCIKPHWNDTLSIADSALVLVAVNDTFPVPQPLDVHLNVKNKTVEISWDAELLSQVFTAYNLERSDDNGKTFKQINPRPIVNTILDANDKLRRITYFDSLSSFNKDYYYRVVGLTPFGEQSQPSDTLVARGKEMLVGVNPIITKSERLEDNQVIVRWEFPDGYDNKLKGFVVERSMHAEGIFKNISDTLPVNTRSFLDKSALSVNYYQVCAISNSGYAYCSFPSLIQFPDSVPPTAPIGLKGEIDSNGVVRLNWGANGEPDLKSYRVYRSNNASKGFTLINKDEISTPRFIDTIPLNNLNNLVFYAVSAQDFSFNESSMSGVIKILKPDTIAPVPPRITNFTSGGNKVVLNWYASTSLDVAKHVIYRKTPDNNSWVLLAVFDTPTGNNQFTDSNLVAGENYAYMLIAVDESGIESNDNQVVKIRTLAQPSSSTEIKLNLRVGENGKQIELKWKDNIAEIERIYIYKAVNAEATTLLKSVKYSEKGLHDSAVKIGNTYTYRLQAITKNGKRMKIGKPFTIKL